MTSAPEFSDTPKGIADQRRPMSAETRIIANTDGGGDAAA